MKSIISFYAIIFQAEKVVEMKDLKYNETELLILWQENYIEKKQEEYAARKDKKKVKEVKY